MSRSFLRLSSVLVLGMAVAGCKVGSSSDGDDGDGDGGGKNNAATAPFFLPTGEPDNTAAPSIELDSKGRVHAVFPAYAGGRAYYATCAADCSGSDAVKVVRFDTDSTVANTMLAIDANDRPHVLLSSFNKVYYATCDDSCGDATSWQQTELLDHRGDREVTGEALALDPAGNPRFMMHTYVAYLGIGQKAPETFYVTCDGNCHDPASWTQHKVADQIWEGSGLRFDADGRIRLATVAHVVNPDQSTTRTAAYVECNGSCEDGDSWVGAGLETAFYSDFDAVSIRPTVSLALTSSGMPRIAVIGQDENMQRRVVYYACDENCSTGAFNGMILSNTNDIGAGLDIALDKNDGPRIAYTYAYNIGILHCNDADCTAQDSGWDVSKVELGSEMKPDDIFLEWNCTVAAWFLHSPSIALTESGAPRVGYQARDISGGWENPNEEKPDCEAGTDMTWSRLSMMSSL
jgi:hypothetical protein